MVGNEYKFTGSRGPGPIRLEDAPHLVTLFGDTAWLGPVRSVADYWLYARLFAETCLCYRDEAGLPVAVVIAFRNPGLNPDRQGDEIYIEGVAAKLDHQGHEHVEALLRELQELSTRWQIPRLWVSLEFGAGSPASFWRSLGYVNPTADYKSHGLWMTKDLMGPGQDRAVFELCHAEYQPDQTLEPIEPPGRRPDKRDIDVGAALQRLRRAEMINIVFSRLLVFAMPLGFLALLNSEVDVPAEVLDIMIISFLVLSLVLLPLGYLFGFRCPFCGRGFGQRAWMAPNHCRRCGERLTAA